MDEYQNSGPKSSQAMKRQREQEIKAQMRDLLAIADENELVSVLKSAYRLTPKDPRYAAIMQIWRDEQQRQQRER